jgi:hypothetical protein
MLSIRRNEEQTYLSNLTHFLPHSVIQQQSPKMASTTEPNDWIKVEYLGRIAIITLNRPERLNALPKDDFYNLSQRLREVDTHAEVTITLLIGKGRFFSACVQPRQTNPSPPYPSLSTNIETTEEPTYPSPAKRPPTPTPIATPSAKPSPTTST